MVDHACSAGHDHSNTTALSGFLLTKDEAARLQAEHANSEAAIQHGSFGIGTGGLDTKAALFWAFVSVPLLWGVWMTLQSAIKIF